MIDRFFLHRASRSNHFCLRWLALLAACWLSSVTRGDETNTSPDVGVRFQPPAVVLLTNAHVVVSSEKEFDSASVLIADGKIVAVGNAIAERAGAEVIDCTGKYLYPAFVDSLVEFQSRPLNSTAGYWNGNVTPERRMDLDVQYDASKLEGLRKAGIGVVLAAPSGGIIKGQSCVITTAKTTHQQSLLRPRAFQHFRLYPARSSEQYPNSPMGAVALVRQALLDADWYQRARQAFNADPALPKPEHNVALEALEAVVRGAQTTVFDGTNELYALRADRVAREFSLKLIVRGSGREYRQLKAIAATNRTYIIPVDFPEAPKLATEADVADATLQSLMHWRLAPENPARLEQAGVDFVFTTEGLAKPADLLPKLRVAIEAGLSETGALRSLTEVPAKLLAVDHLVGTIEPGKLANILLTSGRLFDKSTEINETWVQGDRYRWQAEQATDPRGKWLLATDAQPKELILQISGKPQKLAAKIGIPASFVEQVPEEDEPGSEQDIEQSKVKVDAEEKQAVKPEDIKDFSFDGYQLSGTFEAKAVSQGRSGRAWLSAVVLGENDQYSLEGSLRWSDGSSTHFLGSQVAPDEEANKEIADAKKEPPSADIEKGIAGDATPEDTTHDSKSAQKMNEEQEPVACDANYPLGAYGRSAAPSQPELILFKNATLWTCADDGILESADLLVRDGLIEEIGRQVKAPSSAVVFDATGMHISPGIIDCHSHMATDGGVNESAQAITAEVRVGDFIDSGDITIYRQLAGGVTTSNILHGSANPIGGQNQVIKLRWGLLDEELKMKEAPAGIKFALGENVKQSNRDQPGTRYPQTRMGVEQIIRDRFEAAKLYRRRHQAWSSNPVGLPPRRDLELDALVEVLEGERWIHCHSYRQDEILMMLRLLEEYGITIGSLQHILEGYKVADAMAKHGATGSSFSDWWAYKFEVFDAIPFNGALMHRASVIVSFNSDDAELARHLNHEAAKAIKYGGVEPSEALKFVTLNPARQLRIDKWVGSLEVGKQADFVLWNRSPLSTLSVCMQTWIDGRKYFDRDEDLARRKSDEQLRLELIQAAMTQATGKQTSGEEKDPSLWWARYDEFCHHGHDEQDN